MRYFSIFIICLIGFYSLGQTNNDKSQILALMQEQENCWNKGDLTGFMQGYWKNDSLMFIGKSGITYGWQQTLSNYQKGYPDTASMGKLSFTILEVSPLSNKYYHVVGKWHLARSKGDLQGYYTLLFKKIKGKWFIIKDHSS